MQGGEKARKAMVATTRWRPMRHILGLSPLAGFLTLVLVSGCGGDGSGGIAPATQTLIVANWHFPSITYYSKGAHSDAKPKNEISGSKTQLAGPEDVTVGKDGTL